jgi:membrane-associated phospholipid phosphatase
VSAEHAAWWRLVALLSAAGFALAALFNAWPGLDLAAAALFHEPGAGFPVGDGAVARWLREVYRLAFTAASVAVVVGLVSALARRAGTRVPARLWAFPALLFALGPGALVNGVLKAHWGRARPAQIEAFGGEAAFTLPFEIVEQCGDNCSFVSGEGAAAAALAAALIGLFWARLGPAGRWAAGAATALWLAGAAFIRMAPGRHFLSDTLFAFVLMGLLAALLWRALGMGRPRPGPTAYAADLALAARRAMGAAARALGRLRPPASG